jgi:hypothetical protein
MEAIDGVRYSFRRAGLLIIAIMTRKFKMDPGILTHAELIPAMIDSASYSKKCTSVALDELDVGSEASHFIQQLSLFTDGLIFMGMGTLT